MKLTFLGAVEEVTGSRSLVEHKGTKILVDCGMFQGKAAYRNWEPFPVDPLEIKAVVLTHAHIDHIGYIPRLVKNGFKGKIYCSKATRALASILLIDSASLMEEDARKRNKKAPLYTVQEAEHALSFFETVDYDTVEHIDNDLTFTLIASYHILGSAFVVISDGKSKLTFSGDLGRPDRMIMKDPAAITQTDYLVIESTYGDRLHDEGDPIKLLGEIVNSTVDRGGKLIIPAFAVGRTQAILYSLYQLRQKKIIPEVPVFLDSPMAIDVTGLYCEFNAEHRLSAHTCADAFGIARYTRRVQESKKIDAIKGPAIIIAGSGMADGGRVSDHFKHMIYDAKSTILFVGYQAQGTTGRALLEGMSEFELDGKMYPVNAQIKSMPLFSAHADYKETLEWLGHIKNGLKKVFINHGEKDAAQSLQKKIEERYGWSVVIPDYLQAFDLD